MKKTLGLDLGSNSLGWAILDDITGDILDKGVVVFPEGVDLQAGTSLDTPAATRRAARMGRRMKFRRKLRKWHLLKVLIDANMCPLKQEELDAWKKKGEYPLGNKEFLSWLKATDTTNPYCDRAAAAEGRVAPYTLGRALYHIAQRRGFKSSRKDEAGQIDEETGEMRKPDKKLGAVKSDIEALNKEIAAAGCKTLGQYFFKCLNDGKSSRSKKRIRCRYTGRVEHYEVEFAAIMDAQGYAAGEKLRSALHKAIFMQRPLRSQKHLVGKCPLEPKNARAQIGHPAFEEFRMLSFVNNLSFEDSDGNYRDDNGNLLYPLTAKDREIVCGALMKAAPSVKFEVISKLFRKDPRFTGQGLKFHYYRDDDSVSTCQTRHKIKSAFGEAPYDEQMVFDALTFFDDTDKLHDWFRKHFPGLDEKAVLRLSAIHPKEGNANYSLKAINRILPFLRRGYDLSQARFFAKLPDVIPEFAANEEEILNNLKERLWEYRDEKRRYGELDGRTRKTVAAPIPLLDRYKDYLVTHWGLTEDNWKCLYLHGDGEYVPETEYKCRGATVKLDRPRLPPVNLGMIRNPLVQRAMTTLRRLVNYLGDHGKIDPTDTIRIELARTVNDFAMRKAWQNWQDSRRKLREEAKAEIVKLGVAASEDAIDRYVLWKEQGEKCLYTHKNITLTELLSGKAFDIEHTIPRSLSGDDSLANKTICDAVYNRQVKKGHIPRECPNWDEIDVMLRQWREKVERLEKDYRNQLRSASGKSDPAQRSLARVKALTTSLELKYWRDKLKRFEITSDKLQSADNGLGGFKKRQLVDTGIMCSQAVALLRCVYPATFAVNGTATAFARKVWGIQGDERKDRTEHTHHAKDAMVIAALTPSRFTAICSALKDDGMEHRRECDVCPPPYEGFSEKVRKACDEILVKHVLRQTTLRQSSKKNALARAHREKGDPNGRIIKFVKSQGDTVRGQLHKDTFYGCIQRPGDDAKVFVVRKPLVGPLPAALALVDKIVDPTIRELVKSQLLDMKARGVKNVSAGDVKMPSGVPINKVRIEAQTTSPAKLRNHTMPSDQAYKTPYYVTSAEGSNFRLGLFEENGKKFVVPDNSLVWAQNHKKDDYVPLDQKPGFVGFIMPGTMAIAYREGQKEELEHLPANELGKRLYKVVKFRGDDGRITFRFHREARASVSLEKDLGELGKSKKGENAIAFTVPHELLLLSSKKYLSQMLFEGIDFKMMLDGSIQFIK